MEKELKEILIKNDLGLKVYINGVPDLTLMPTEVFNSFISVLELQISEYLKKNSHIE